jgi:hypothetical protein
MATNVPFLGRGWSFPPTFRDQGRSVDMTEDVVDIERSLEILLSTRIGERVMRPRYGCTLDRLVFEPLDATLQSTVRDLIRTAILYYEPRILLDDVILTSVPDEGRLDIELQYTVATTNTRYNFVYPFYLEEGVELS